MFRNIIKKFALSLVADDIKAMINEAVSDAMESISDHIDLKDLADTVAESISVDAEEIARHIDTSDIAGDLDLSSVAENIDIDQIAETIAENIDMDAVSEGIDLDDLANAMNKVRQMRRRIRLAKKS
jgi:hypothetical protein